MPLDNVGPAHRDLRLPRNRNSDPDLEAATAYAARPSRLLLPRAVPPKLAGCGSVAGLTYGVGLGPPTRKGRKRTANPCSDPS